MFGRMCSPLAVRRSRRATVSRSLVGIVAGLALLGIAGPVSAADSDEPLVVQTSPALPVAELAPVRGLELRVARDLVWSRLSLADDAPDQPLEPGLDMTVLRASSLFAGIDPRQDLWTATPGAMTSVATAATSLMTRGMSMFEVLRGGKIRQRHTIRCFFRSSGIKLAWRIEF
jgi:hypothetical protein